MTTKHGGHLGFFEGGIMVPNNVTWCDRAIIQFMDAVANLYLHGKLPGHTDLTQEVTETSQNDINTKEETGLLSDNSKVTLRNRNTTLDDQVSSKSADGIVLEEKRGSLKKGTFLQQATSYVQ